MLDFKSEGHVYLWDGEVVPSVSQILKKIGITRDYEQVDDFYRQRGTFVHQAIEYHIKHTLEESSLDPENVLPYFLGYKKWTEKEMYVPRETELPLYSQKYGFAGTIDQTCIIENERDGEGICDIKVTESSDKAADLQLCAYAQLYYEAYGRWPAFRMVLELHGDQSVKPIFYDTDPAIWGSVMELYNWKIKRRSKVI
jgi:hypothetical protein